MLWGGNARAKKALITNKNHLVLECAHPSPLSAYRGFFGCNHFKKANEYLEKHGESITPDKYVLVLRKKDRDALGEKIIASLRRATVGKISSSVLDKVVLSSRTASVKGGFLLEAGDYSLDASIDAIIENIKRKYGEDISEMLFNS